MWQPDRRQWRRLLRHLYDRLFSNYAGKAFGEGEWYKKSSVDLINEEKQEALALLKLNLRNICSMGAL